MPSPDWLRPYRAAFASRFLQMLQYRTAAWAGFATQCWWGGMKVMVLAAFYGGATAAQVPLTLAQAITYTWVAQALLALLPWMTDPEVAQAVRTGSVAYDRLRPVDGYALWFARSAGWTAARALPRAALMLAVAGVLLPLAGWGEWAWQPPQDVAAALGFAASLVLALALSTAVVMLLNIATAGALYDGGINAVAGPLIVVFSGNLVPLALLPEAWQTALLLQPLAGVVDIPARIYFGQLQGAGLLAGLGLQAAWTVGLVVLGRAAMARTMQRLEVQGG